MEDRVIGILFAVLGGTILFLSFSIDSNFPGSGDPGPALVPRVLGSVMALLGLLLAVRTPAKLDAGQRASVEKSITEDSLNKVETLAPPVMWRRVAIMACLILYVALFEVLGFSLASLLFAASTMVLLGEITIVDIAKKTAISALLVVGLGFILNGPLGQSVQGVWIG